MRSFTVVVLFACVTFVGGAEICRVVHPGSECQETCKEGYTEKAANFPFCYHSYKCCEAPPTTTPISTESTTPLQKKTACGLEALPATARILKSPLLPVSLNNMDCAWPWVVSMQMTAGNLTAHVCNGVLINENAFLTTRSCSDFLNITDVKVRAAVGICNVSNINDAALKELVEPTIDIGKTEPGLSIVKFKEPLDPNNYSLQLLPVCLPEESTEFRTDDRACVMASRAIGSPIVTSGRISVVDVAGCDFLSQFLTDKPQPEGTFCTATKTDNVDACYGDEGGIVMCPDQNNRWVLKGVIQYGTCQVGHHPDEIDATNQIIDIEGLSGEIEEKLSAIE